MLHPSYAQVRPRAPKVWIPSLMWNDNIPDPVDFRGRTLDRRTGRGEESLWKEVKCTSAK